MTIIKTPLCHLLEIDLPIIQAPIGSASCPELAAAVAVAGGLGMLALSWRSVTECRQLIRTTKQLTDRPFGINLCLAWPQQERLAACLEEGVKIISLFWGDPGPYLPAIHAAGAIAIQTAGSAQEARRYAEMGVDAIVAQGWEAGGHVWGSVATLPLVPQVVDAVAPVPVIAAGGIADGRGVAAALALGAAGVWIGTRFIATVEANAHTIYKERVAAARATDTIYTELFDIGWPAAPHRVLRNSTVEQWQMQGSPHTRHRPGETETIATFPDGRPIARYSDVIPLPGMSGDVEALALYAGQSVGLIGDIKPAAEIVKELAEGAVRALRNCQILIS